MVLGCRFLQMASIIFHKYTLKPQKSYTMNTNIQLIISQTDETTKNNLQKSIEKKRHKLMQLTKKLDALNHELETIKKEYQYRIGRLYAKDNELDIEIIKYKNILRLIEEGITYEEAKKELEEFWLNNLFNEKEQQFSYEETFEDNIEQDTKQHKEKYSELKKLWKKLILEFHPDLVTNPKEKTKREAIMKRINKAYKENNIEALRLLEGKLFIEETKPSTTDELEYMLVEIENLIVGLTRQYRSLRMSEWFVWKIRLKKAEKAQKDIFQELEKSLLEDIVSKQKILKSLKIQVGETA